MRRLLLSLFFGATLVAQPATLVIKNAKIVTLDAGKPEARALAARGDIIVALGSDAEMARYIGPETKVLDLGGRLAIPGFIEGHGHFTGVGRFRMELNLRESRSWDAIVEQVNAAARRAKPGDWILGRGWHQEKWSRTPQPNVEGFPLHDALSKAAPNNPVLLVHASGHAAFANAAALKAAGVTKDTPNPPGGDILHDAQGNPTGMLRERAQGLVSSAMQRDRAKRTAAQREADAEQEIDLAEKEALANGITSFQDAGSPPDTMARLRRRAEMGKSDLRLWVMARTSNDNLQRNWQDYRVINAGNKHYTVRAIKSAIDGALGPRGAWLLEPYSDSPQSSGLNTGDPADIARTAKLALEHGFQFCVHAIGDRANRETLNIFENAFKGRAGGGKDLRWRIEHAQHINGADIARFGSLGVIASMQGVHCTSDAPYVTPRLGPKRSEEGAYVWRSLMNAGAVVTNGTDAPVEDISPIASYYSTVSRRLKDGSVFYPAQRLTRIEALRSYTLSNAYAAFEEDIKGSLTPGKLADVTVLSRDILTVPEEQIPGTAIVHTIVGGKVVYSGK